MLFIHRIFSGIWFIERSYAENYIPLITSYIDKSQGVNTGPVTGAVAICSYKGDNADILYYEVNSRYSVLDFIERAPKNTVILININHSITKYDQDCGPYGMETYSRILKAAYASDNVKGVALRIDSGGGEGTGMRLLMETISQRNKPVIAFVDDFAASAAYGIASSCDHITAGDNTARIGSIGCYLTVADYTEYFNMRGINLKEVYARQSKDKNKEYYEAISGNTKALEDIATVYCDSFISAVEKNRAGKLAAGADVWGTGKVFFSEKALELGLIDNIDTFDNFLNYFNT